LTGKAKADPSGLPQTGKRSDTMSKTQLIAIAVMGCLFLTAAGQAAEETIHFREGGGEGYTDVTFDDTWIMISPADDTTRGNDGYNGIEITASTKIFLLAIKDLFSELPATSGGCDIQINSATLHLFRYAVGTSSIVVSVYPTVTDWLPDDAGSNENDTTGQHAEKSSETHWGGGGNWSTSDYDDSVCNTGNWVDDYNEECELIITDVISELYSEAANYGIVVRADGSLSGRASEASQSLRPSLEINYEYVGATYTLTVNSGTGDGDYAEAATPTIAADTAPSGQEFAEWVGDTSGIASVTSSSTTLTMPAANQEVTATYTDKTWTLTVNSGSGDGSYVVATEVPISADTAPSGQDFAAWVGDTEGIASTTSSSTTLTMPYADTEVTATYTDKVWTLTVNSGTGDGSYAVDTEVPISADAPASGKGFDEWIGDTSRIADVSDSSTTLTMPYGNVEITATYVNVYALTVNSGTGDGTYEESEVADIAADSAPSGKEFDVWTGDVTGIADTFAPSTTLTMPTSDVEITANYVNIRYLLTVNSGTGDGYYAENTIVNISADTPPTNQQFDEWVGDTSEIADVSDPTTTITIPAGDAEVTATYTDITYTLTVNKGSGDGSYAYSTVVDITADAPASGTQFDEWVGDTAGIADMTDATTTITMPAAAAEITATYVNVYALTVNSGTGDGTYEATTVVDITADAAPSGQDFVAWTGDTEGIADVGDPTTTITMPAADAETTATYTDKTWALTVNSGLGDGSYVVATVVDINADAPASGKQFDQWIGDTTGIANTEAADTTLTMPYADAEITATYEDAGAGTTQLIVDWGDSAANNVYDFSDWDNVYLGPYTSYSSVGPDGVVGSTSKEYGTCGVNGSSESFSEGDQIVVTWYNDTGSSVTFTPKVSFDDEDHPDGGSSSGTWYDMTQLSLDDAESGTTGYTFTSETAGSYSRVHACRYKNNESQLMCDKIELVTEGGGPAYYTLTVNSGTGDGSYAANTVVDIDADAPASGKQFDEWIGDTSGIANVNLASTTITMPSSNAEITATYEDIPSYTLTVNSGTGDGSYYANTEVGITADTAPSGHIFDEWVGDTSGIANVNAASTSLTMPASNAEVTATYTPDTLYTLTVNSGTGDGSYQAGWEAGITADAAPSGKAFDEWVGDTSGIGNVNASSTTLTMPAANAEVTATYADAPGSYDLTVNNGTGDGNYTESQVVDITADAAASGKFFDAWTGDTASIADVNDPSTTITMPASNAEITATYEDVASGLVSRYTFEVDGRDSIGTNDGTLTGGASIADDGSRGKVLSLDGVDDYVSLPASGLAAGRGEVTLSLWVKPDEWIGSNTIYDEYANTEWWQFTVRQGEFLTRDTSTGTTGTRDNDLSMPTVPTTGSWHHLAFVYSVTGGTKTIYYDGEVYATTSSSVDTLTSDRDGAAIGYPSDGNYYDGMIDDVRLYNRALSTTEIALLAEQTLYTLTVNSGSGGGDYGSGSVVDISADAPSTGEAFDSWVGDTSGIADVYDSTTTLTMPAANAEITATYATAYTLTVNNGSGDGQYTENTIVDISADDSASGQSFDEWVGDTSGIANVNVSSTTITMPAADAEITATYQAAILYTLTVNSGTGDGDYQENWVVDITADTAPSGQAFDEWVGNTSGIADVTDSSTTITMPASNAEITATYDTAYTLTVNSGSGDGSYVAGQVVDISADSPPTDQEFDEWVGDVSDVANIYAADTTVTMPAGDVEVTAVYVTSSGPTINAVSGTISHGNSMTISGNGFGNKSTAAPFKYDDFEDGTVGERIYNGWYTWSNEAGSEPEYDDTYKRDSAYARQSAYIQHDTAYNSTLGLVNLGWNHDDKVYISAWWYYTTAGAESRNYKHMAFRGGNAGQWENPRIRADQWPSLDGGRISAWSCSGEEIGSDYALGGTLYLDAWHRMEWWMDLKYGGEVRVWRDLNHWCKMLDIPFDFSTENINNCYFGAYFARDWYTPLPQMWLYWDEIYVDKTKARVEIGNSSTWSGCSHREIQIPSAWSSGSITVTVNQGTFADSSGAYLYVVDSDGNVNSSGYSITFD